MAEQAQKPQASASSSRCSSFVTRPSLTKKQTVFANLETHEADVKVASREVVRPSLTKKQTVFANLETHEADVKVARRKSGLIEPPPPPTSSGHRSTSTVDAESPPPRRQTFSSTRSPVVPETSKPVSHRRTNARPRARSSPSHSPETSSPRPCLSRESKRASAFVPETSKPVAHRRTSARPRARSSRSHSPESSSPRPCLSRESKRASVFSELQSLPAVRRDSMSRGSVISSRPSLPSFPSMDNNELAAKHVARRRGLLSDMRRMYAENACKDPEASAESKMRHVMASVRKATWAMRWKAATIDELQAMVKDSSSATSSDDSDDSGFDEQEVAIESIDFLSALSKLNLFSSEERLKWELSEAANNPDKNLHEQIMAQTERLRDSLASLEDLCRSHLSSFDSLSDSMSDNISDSIRRALEITKSVKNQSRELKRSNTESKMVHDLCDIATEVTGCLKRSVSNVSALRKVALAFQKCPSLRSRLSPEVTEHCSETIDKLAESSPHASSDLEPAANDLLRHGATPANPCSVPRRGEAAKETDTTICADSVAILSTQCGNSAICQLTGAPREGTWSVDDDATTYVEEQLLSTSIRAEGQEIVADVDSHFSGLSQAGSRDDETIQVYSLHTEGPTEESNGGGSGRASSKCSASSAESWMVLSSSDKVEANRIQSEGEHQMGTPIEAVAFLTKQRLMCESKPGTNSLECKTDADGLESKTDVNSAECKAGANSPECETGTNHFDVEKEGAEQVKGGLWRLASEEHVGPRILVEDGDDRSESADESYDESLTQSEPTPRNVEREKLRAGNRPAMMIQVPYEIYCRKDLYMNEPVVVRQPFRRKHNIRTPRLDQTRVTVEAVCRQRCSKPSWCSRLAEAKTTPLQFPQLFATPTKNVTKSASVSGSSPRKRITVSTLPGKWIPAPHTLRLPPVRVLHDGSMFV